MNYYKLILIFNIFYLIKSLYKCTQNDRYLRTVNIEPTPQFINNYDDELIKLSTVVYNDILHNFIDANDDILEYEFNILCIEYYDNFLCDEYTMLKYNIRLEQVEQNIINFLYYVFNSISIFKYNKNDKSCCNLYKITWID
jgi:hypothetical protein